MRAEYQNNSRLKPSYREINIHFCSILHFLKFTLHSNLHYENCPGYVCQVFATYT